MTPEFRESLKNHIQQYIKNKYQKFKKALRDREQKERDFMSGQTIWNIKRPKHDR